MSSRTQPNPISSPSKLSETKLSEAKLSEALQPEIGSKAEFLLDEEIKKLRIENHRLKSIVFQLQRQLAEFQSRQLIQERRDLESEFGSDIFMEKK